MFRALTLRRTNYILYILFFNSFKVIIPVSTSVLTSLDYSENNLFLCLHKYRQSLHGAES